MFSSVKKIRELQACSNALVEHEPISDLVTTDWLDTHQFQAHYSTSWIVERRNSVMLIRQLNGSQWDCTSLPVLHESARQPALPAFDCCVCVRTLFLVTEPSPNLAHGPFDLILNHWSPSRCRQLNWAVTAIRKSSSLLGFSSSDSAVSGWVTSRRVLPLDRLSLKRSVDEVRAHRWRNLCRLWWSGWEVSRGGGVTLLLFLLCTRRAPCVINAEIPPTQPLSQRLRLTEHTKLWNQSQPLFLLPLLIPPVSPSQHRVVHCLVYFLSLLHPPRPSSSTPPPP